MLIYLTNSAVITLDCKALILLTLLLIAKALALVSILLFFVAMVIQQYHSIAITPSPPVYVS
jgi:hypothetical protein